MAGFKFKPLPPEEAIRFFNSKGFAIGFDWRDIWKEEHAVAFTVAKVARLDILEDIRAAVAKAQADGIPFREFKNQLEPTLVKKGWWGRKSQMDPVTRKFKNVQLGSPRRLRIIYDTKPHGQRSRALAAHPAHQGTSSIFALCFRPG